jgi:hypothetical protein
MKLPIATLLVSSIFVTLGLSPVASAQVQTAPVFAGSNGGLSLLDPNDPHYDPYLFVFNAPPPQGRPAPPLLREAIVDVHLNIRADGKVGKVEILDGFHDGAVERALRIPLEDMLFQPATAGGEPVAFEKLDVRIVLRGAYPPGVTEDLRVGLTELSTLITNKDLQGAERFASNLREDQALRLFELALVEDQLAAIYAEAGKVPEAILASRLATGSLPSVLPPEGAAEGVEYPETFLTSDLHFDAQRRHFIVSLLGNQTGEALATWEELQIEAAQLGKQDLLKDISPRVEQLQALLNSEEPVGSAVRLVDGHWDFIMSNRRIFGVTGLQGQVDYIDVACGDNPKRRLAFQNDSEFRIPDSWGQCRLEFEGRDGSQFNLYEYLN